MDSQHVWARGKELPTLSASIACNDSLVKDFSHPFFDVDLGHKIHSQHFLGKRKICNFELDWISVHPVKRQRYGILLPFLEEMTPNVLWQYIRRNMECTDPRVQLHKLCTVKSKHASAPRIKKGREDPRSMRPIAFSGQLRQENVEHLGVHCDSVTVVGVILVTLLVSRDTARNMSTFIEMISSTDTSEGAQHQKVRPFES